MTRAKFERNLLIFLFVAMLGLIVFMSFVKKNHNHFEMHTNAGRALVHEELPYAKSLNDSASGGYASWWLYSPTAALSFAPFSYLPSSWGLFVYLILSVAAFAAGLRALLDALGIPFDTRGMRWFYLPAFSELVGGVQSEKPEVAMVGLILLSMAWLLRGRMIAAAVLLALPTVWKVQPLAIGGLLALALLRESGKKDLPRFALSYAAGIATFLAAPLLFVSFPFLREAFTAWSSALNEAVRETWHGNMTLYNFLRGYFGFPRDHHEVRMVGLVVAAIFALVIALPRFGSRLSRLGLALALGSVYGVLLSPLSQGTTYVFGTPALLIAVLVCLTLNRGWYLIFYHWIVTSIVWSDLVPEAVSHFFGSFNARSTGFMALVGYLIYQLCYRRVVLRSQSSL